MVYLCKTKLEQMPYTGKFCVASFSRILRNFFEKCFHATPFMLPMWIIHKKIEIAIFAKI